MARKRTQQVDGPPLARGLGQAGHRAPAMPRFPARTAAGCPARPPCCRCPAAPGPIPASAPITTTTTAAPAAAAPTTWTPSASAPGRERAPHAQDRRRSTPDGLSPARMLRRRPPGSEYDFRSNSLKLRSFPWPASPSKIACIRSTTCSTWSCSPSKRSRRLVNGAEATRRLGERQAHGGGAARNRGGQDHDRSALRAGSRAGAGNDS